MSRAARAVVALACLLSAVPALASVTISGQFTPLAINQGDRTRMRINFQSNDTVAPVVGANFFNVLPAPLVLYDPTFPGYVAPQGNCNSATVAGQVVDTSPAYVTTTGNNRVDLVNGTIPVAPSSVASGSCFIEVDVTVATGPTTSYTNALVRANFSDPPTNTPVDGTTDPQFSLNVTGLSSLTASKAFAASPLVQGNTTTVTITINNPNSTVAVPLTTFSDTLPANLAVVGTPTAACPGGSNPTVTSAANANPIAISGGTIAAAGSCTISATVRGLLAANTITTAATNSIAVNDVGNTRGLSLDLPVSTPITVNSPLRVTKSFSPNPLSRGQAATATVTIFNDSASLLTGLRLTDDTTTGWPAQIDNTAAPTASPGCGAADIAAGAGGRGFVLGATTPGSIAAGGSCVITIPITSNTVSAGPTDWTNAIPQGAVANNEGFTSPAASARLDVRDTLPNVGKSVAPTSAAPGDLVTYSVAVTSFNPAAQTGVTFTDTLPGGMLAILAAAPGATLPSISGAVGCGNLVVTGTPAAPTFTFDMPVAAAGGSTCTVRFQARVPLSATPGAAIPANASGPITGPGINAPSASSPAVTVLQPFSVQKLFDGAAAVSRSQGTPVQLTVTLTNNNFTALANVGFTDTLPTAPGNLVVANPPNASTTCAGGAVTAIPGAGSISLAGASVPARNTTTLVAGTCVVRVNVVGGTASSAPGHSNTIPAGGVTGSIPASSATGNAGAPIAIANAAATTASVQYTPALTVAKSFLTNPVNVGGVSRARVVLGNVGGGVLSNVSVNDPISTIAGITLASPPNAVTTCTGGTNIDTSGGNVALTGATLSPGGSCDLLFDVVATNGAASTNSIPIGNVTADGGVVFPNVVSAVLTKQAGAITVTKNFTPNAINSPGQPSQLQITLTNTGALALTGIALTDNLPVGMRVAAVPNASTTCAGGIVGASAGGSVVGISGASLGVGASCVINAEVTHLVLGALTNTIPAGAITTTQGITNTTPFSANLASQQNVGVQKAFVPAAAPPNTPVRLILTVNNTLGVALAGLSVVDNLPTNMVVAPVPNAQNTCGGTFAPVAGASSFTASGGALPAGPSSCTLAVDVIGTAIGALTNSIPPGGVSANGGAVTNPTPATTATLNVLNPATVAKAFSVSPVRDGGITRLTVTLGNPNGVPLTGAVLADNLPAGLFVAPVPNTATTCGGATVTAVPSGASVSLTGATIPATGSCTFAVDTVSNTPGTYTNTIPASALTTAQGVTNAAPASAPLSVLQFPTLAKSFAPAFLQAGQNSTLTINLGNPNAVVLTLAANLDDNLPAGLTVAGAAATTCAPGTVVASLGSALVRYNAGGSIPAGGCTITVPVTSAVSGNYTNTLAAGALSTTQAGSNQTSASANVVFSALGAISGTVYRDRDNNGSVGATDTGIGGQTVELLDNTGTVIQTAVTDPTGNYLFTGLAAGTYSVRQPAQPAGTLDGKNTAGTAFINGTGTAGTASAAGQATVGAPSRINDITLNLALGVVSSSPGNNFGEVLPSQVSGRVYGDLNNSGTVDGAETGFSGVPVTLSGFDDLGNPVLLNATTDGTGNYAFTGLRPSCGSPGAAACPPGNLPGYTITEGTQPANTANGREAAGTVTDITSGAATGTAGTASNNTAPTNGNAPAGTSRIASIILPGNARSQNNNFGEIPNNRTITGRVFVDNNGDGQANGADAGVGSGAAGVNNVPQTLTLTGTDVAGNTVNVTTTTDANGNYSFGNLLPGTYTVTCTTCAAPTGFVNGAAYPGSTGGNGAGTGAVPQIVGIDLNGATNTASSANNFTKTQGNGAISGRIYRDDNNNGLVDGSDAGIAGQTVRLLDSNGVQVATTTTAADGTYSFNGLSAGTYTVEQPAQPAGTNNGITSAGTITGTGTAGTATLPAVTPSRITNITLQSVGGNVASSPNNNFGELPNTRTVSGRVFTDFNGDGVFNTAGGNDAGVGTGAAGANNLAQSLTLTGLDLNGIAVNLVTTTAANGTYAFNNVPPGTNYTITCTTCPAPVAAQNGSAYAGTVNGVISGAGGGTQAVPTIGGINVGPAASLASINNNFTKIVPSQQISGFVYFDPNNNGGVREPGDSPVPAQTVQLLDAAGLTVLATATTDATGYYVFSSATVAALTPGTYRVRYNAPPTGVNVGLTSAGTVTGVSVGTASGVGVAPAQVSAIVVGAGAQSINNNFPLVSTSAIGGKVYDDRDLSGTFNGGDAAIANVTMTLTGTDAFGNAVSRTTTTNALGDYNFANLPPGNYVVTQTQPAGFTSVANTPGTVTSGSAGTVGPLGGASETIAITLAGPAGGAPNVNFGEKQTAGSMRGFKSVANQTRPGQQPAAGDILIWTIIYKNESAATLPLQVTDVLPAVLTRTGAPAITLSTSGTVTGVTLDPAYTGRGANNLLNGGASFGPGAVVAINLPVVVLPAATGTVSNQANATATGAPVPTSQVDNSTVLPIGVVVPVNSLPQPAPTNANANNQVPTVVRVGAVPASLSGFVWRDNNGDRQRDSGDTPIPSWGVAVYDASGALVSCTVNNSVNGCVTMPNGQSLFRTDANGAYGVTGLQPGPYKIEFRDPANNVIFGTPANSGGDPASRVAVTRDALEVNLVSGQNLVRQDLPIDPSGVIYNTATREPIAGSRVELCGPPGFNPTTMLVGGASYTVSGQCASLITGSTGFYQYLLTPGAPAGVYTLGATAPGFAPAPSGTIPPSAGPFTPAGPTPLLVQAQAGPPPVGQPTTYYLSFNLGPGVPDVIHNHIPLDSFAGAGLFLQKQVNRDVVELGDSLQYTLRVVSPNGAATGLFINDALPAGMRLIPGSVTLNNAPAPDPGGAPGPALRFNIGNLAAGVIATVTYRVRVGVGAQQGDGINRARANAVVGGNAVSSNEARARVRITSGVFFQEACVLGKIFVDCNNNRIQDPEELGIPGVRMYLHDGTYLISDSEGKYSYCGLPARTGAMRVDPTTLPLGSQLVTSSNRNALDAGSLFLDLRIGELHRADFVEGSCSPGVVEQVKARRAKGNVVAPIQEKKPQPRLIFDSGSLRQSVPRERNDVMRSCPAGTCMPAGEGGR
ncbi:MAG: DUF11 domain-containing protein [Burkholderiales bacterium]|nr:DUF11 domain-containing protein [Burkholderiales bacterium]